jgi:hypothetical protein
MSKVEDLLLLAQRIADQRPDFLQVKGPGIGDKDTASFVRELRAAAINTFGKDYAEQRICGENNLSVDFYFPGEASIVEVALTLRFPQSEFEKDVLKAIIAKERGANVEHLVFLSKPGALKRHKQPGSRAIQDWAQRNHGLAITIYELKPPSTLPTDP